MKKDRDSFFSENSMYSSAMPNPNLNVANSPYTMQSAGYQSFYAGPGNMPTNIPNNYTIPTNNNANYIPDYSELEARLSKIERQINRLDARLNKLETNGFITTEDIDSNNVYML